MPQITIHLDDRIDARVKAAAQAAGMSASLWVARLVEEHIHIEWPASVRALAGTWPDFPDAATLRRGGF